MSNTVLDTVTINGVTYHREGTQQPASKPGKRAVVVVDRGWIFAGDVDESEDRIVITNAVQVLSWSQTGFAGLCNDPTKAGAKLLKLNDPVDLPSDAEIFRVKVADSWGK